MKRRSHMNGRSWHCTRKPGCRSLCKGVHAASHLASQALCPRQQGTEPVHSPFMTHETALPYTPVLCRILLCFASIRWGHHCQHQQQALLHCRVNPAPPKVQHDLNECQTATVAFPSRCCTFRPWSESLIVTKICSNSLDNIVTEVK